MHKEWPRPREYAVVVMVCVVACAVWFYEVLPAPSKVIYGFSDAFNYAWRIWWYSGGFLKWGGDIFFAPQIFYPTGHFVAEAEITPLHIIPAGIISRLTDPVFAYNAAIIASFIAAGVVAYVYARRMGLRPGGALLAGFIWAFNPFHSAHAMGHLPLMGVWVLPLGLLAIEELASALAGQVRRRAVVGWTVTLGVAIGLSAWSSWYYFVMFGIAFAVYALVRFCGGPRETRLSLKPLVAALAIGALMAAPLYLIVATQTARTPEYALQNIAGAAPHAYLVPYAYRRWWDAYARTLFTRNAGEDSLFLGWLPLVLAFVGLRKRESDASAVAPAILMLAVAFVLSLGPYLYLGGPKPVQVQFTVPVPEWAQSVLEVQQIDVSQPVRLPVRLLAELPVFSGMREYGRFGLVVVLPVALLAGMGLDTTVRWLRERGRSVLSRAVIWTALAVVALEFVPASFVTPATASPAEEWLAANVTEGVVIYMPDTNTFGDEAMFKTVYTGLPIAMGDATVRPKEYERALGLLTGFPDEASIKCLRELGVTHIVWRTKVGGPLPASDAYEVVAEFPDEVVAELRPGPDSGEVPAQRGVIREPAFALVP